MYAAGRGTGEPFFSFASPNTSSRAVATAICGIVPPNRLDPATGFFLSSMRTLGQSIPELLEKEQTQLISALTNVVAGAAQKRANESEIRASTAFKKAQGPEQIALRKKDLTVAQSQVKKAREYGQSVVKQLLALDWPVKKNRTLEVKTRFVLQPTLASGTGFMFATGYVMTATHCIPDRGQWPQHKVCLNVQSVVVKPAVDGGYATRVVGGSYPISR